MKNYKRRILDSMLEKKLQAKGAVLIEGRSGVERLLLRKK